MKCTVCGVDCSTCKEFKQTCEGCSQIEGRVFGASYMELDTCPMYQCCVHEKHLEHCGQCSELPCEIYFETRDPEMSEEQHLAGIKRRVDVLRSL